MNTNIRNIFRHTILSNLRLLWSGVLSTVFVSSLAAGTADAQQSAADLAKKLSNPIASMISVPFQFNYDSGYGSENGNKVLLNIQPVIPFSLNDDWNLITRTIIPIKNEYNTSGNSGNHFGLSDTVASFWFSPKEPTAGGLIWGAGPVAYLPTSTDKLLGPGKWGGGATVIGLMQKGPWTIGGLANQIWTFEDSTIRSSYMQPFISYTTPTAWTYSLNTETTHNWNTGEWQVPINAMISKLVTFGKQPVQFQGGIGYYASHFSNGPKEWTARFAVTFLFPTGG
jgi:hypothetical protein